MNPNMQRESVIYALCNQSGDIGYIGSTTVNAKTRWWEHRSRARAGHTAPVYDWMREQGINSIEYRVIETLSSDEDIPSREAAHIKAYLDQGHPITNQIARDGVPHSNGDRMKKLVSEKRKGKPTWIKGKKGLEAGWTEERKRRQAMTLRETLMAQ